MKNELSVNDNINNLSNTNISINIDFKNAEKVTTKTKGWALDFDIKHGLKSQYVSTIQEINKGGNK